MHSVSAYNNWTGSAIVSQHEHVRDVGRTHNALPKRVKTVVHMVCDLLLGTKFRQQIIQVYFGIDRLPDNILETPLAHVAHRPQGLETYQTVQLVEDHE